jgi:chorismate mutase
MIGPQKPNRYPVRCIGKQAEQQRRQQAGESMSVGPQDELARLRGSIDNIDAAIVHMLAERFKCTQQVGRLKAEYKLPPADPAREREQIERLRRLAEDARLDPGFAEKFLNFIIAEVIRHHERIAGEE